MAPVTLTVKGKISNIPQSIQKRGIRKKIGKYWALEFSFRDEEKALEFKKDLLGDDSEGWEGYQGVWIEEPVGYEWPEEEKSINPLWKEVADKYIRLGFEVSEDLDLYNIIFGQIGQLKDKMLRSKVDKDDLHTIKSLYREFESLVPAAVPAYYMSIRTALQALAKKYY